MTKNARAQGDSVRIHFQLVGLLLERLSEYRTPRLSVVKDVICQALSGMDDFEGSRSSLRRVLCVRGIPLVADKVLDDALRAMEADGTVAHPKGGAYKLVIAPRPRDETVLAALKKAWESLSRDLRACSFDDFAGVIAVLFARYGCAAYSTLVGQHPGALARIEPIVNDVMHGRDDAARSEMLDCLRAFVDNGDPALSSLKLRLANAYVVLRMNGAGNWDESVLHASIRGKKLLLDTNILFLLVGPRGDQARALLSRLEGLGASFLCGRESLAEFAGVLESQSSTILRLLEKNVKVERLVQSHLLQQEWLVSLVEEVGSPTPQIVQDRASHLPEATVQWLCSQHYPTVDLDRGGAPEDRRVKAATISERSARVRHRQKHEKAIEHDILLWEACEGADRLADGVLSLDRSLSAIEVEGHRLGFQFDEMTSCVMLGAANEQDMADLFSYTLARDLLGDGTQLRFDDLQALSHMEASVLNAPPEALRVAARRIASLRRDALEKGVYPAPEDVQRLAFHTLTSWDDDKRRLLEASENAKLLQRALDDERERGEEALRSLHEANEREAVAAVESQALGGKVAALENEVARLGGELARNQASVEITREQKDEAVSLRKETEEHSRVRREWMLVAAGAVAVGLLLLLFFHAKWSGSAILVSAVLVLIWMAFVHRTPPVSARAIAAVLGLASVAGGVIEKASVIKAFFGK